MTLGRPVLIIQAAPGSLLHLFYGPIDLQGFTLRSKITGVWNGKSFAGQYQTSTTDGSTAVDDGTWNAAKAGAGG